MKYIIANWKANKTLSEAQEWIKTFNEIVDSNLQIKEKLDNDILTVIIAPAHPFIYPLETAISTKKNVYLGVQDISSTETGSYTGEVTAQMLSPLAKFSLIGHSERRQNFNENEEIIKKKIDLAKKYGIEPILCIRDTADTIYNDVNLVAYEPVEAIGSGNNQRVDEVISAKKQFSFSQPVKFIYGGSVNEENSKEYLQNEEIDGLLVGTASLDVNSFSNILNTI